MKTFYVKKESNTYSDTLEVIGLAKILNSVFHNISEEDFQKILIEDKGHYFSIDLKPPLNEEYITNCSYFDLYQYIATKKDKKEEIESLNCIDYEHEKEIRNNYYKTPKGKKEDSPVRKDYDIIRLLAGMPAYKKSFENFRKFENNFPDLIKMILSYYTYTSFLTDEKTIIKKIDQTLKKLNIKPNKINSLQDINPDKGKGVNKPKANSIAPSNVSNCWLRQLVRFCGVWESVTSRYIKKDYKTYVIVPNKISYEDLNSTFKAFKKSVQGSDSIKLDIILTHILIKELIKHHEKYIKTTGFIMNPKDKISGFQTAYFKNLGQRPAVTNIGFLTLPGFINITSIDQGNEWIDVVDEHKYIISRIDENHSSSISMLMKYREFISGSNFDSFFDFCFEYSNFLISSISDKKFYIKPFFIKHIEVLMQTDEKFMKIIENKGFKAVANAIRNSTIKPIFHGEKKDVVFGLSQKFKIASRDKHPLVMEVSEFIQQYNERLMLKDYQKKQHPKYVTTEELEEFISLMDSSFDSKLIAGMLIAYGFAKEPSKNKD